MLSGHKMSHVAGGVADLTHREMLDTVVTDE